MNDMNELTNKLQQVMVPKAALIAYEYRENRYGNGMHYLELHPINDRGRMEAAMPVTYEFMDSLVESYTDDRRNVPHGKIPANMLWCDTRKGHERYIWYNPPGKRQMFFAGSLNIPDGIFHVPGVIYKVSGDRLDIFSYKGEKPVENSPLFLAPFFNVTGSSVCLGNASKSLSCLFMGFNSFSSNGLARAFSVTETRLLPVGFLLPPRWENSLSQKRFSQYSRSFEKVMSSGGVNVAFPRQIPA